jgi:aminoglycoside 2'-N-acetyltransferase I
LSSPRVVVAHTATLEEKDLAAARALLYRCFADMTETDWEHALGGTHAFAFEHDELVGHAALVPRRLLYGGRALRTGYVEAVAVDPAHRRKGHASAMMAELEQIIGAAYELGALGATDEGARFYQARGWRPWQGTTWAQSPQGRMRTPGEDGAIFVLGAELDLAGELTCDWRDGDPW